MGTSPPPVGARRKDSKATSPEAGSRGSAFRDYPGIVDRAGVATWMDAYRDAWISNEPAAIGALFTDDALYSIDAFAEPWRGREEIVRRWTAGIAQQVAFTFEVQVIEGDVAFVHWHVFTQNVGDPIRVEYDGLLQLRFAPDGRCAEHREWFFRRELG